MKGKVWTKSAERVEKLLLWMIDHHQEDSRVTIGCKNCSENKEVMASTALTALLNPFNCEHDVWIRNPFRRKK